MSGVSPHQYRQEARSRGLSEAVIDRVLAQAAPPERSGAPAILTLGHLARRMDIGHGYLRRVIANQDGSHYREFRISKRSGGGRRIAVPEPRLMAVQRWIVREILKSQPVHASSYAYARHSSIVKCARQHVGAGWLLKLDIHDFFESIQERSVYRVFRAIGYQPLVSFELARLCTRPWIDPAADRGAERLIPNPDRRGIDFYRRDLTGYLPQGAPTSPMLSNLACKKLGDARSEVRRQPWLIAIDEESEHDFPTAGRNDRDLAFVEAEALLQQDRPHLTNQLKRSCAFESTGRPGKGQIVRVAGEDQSFRLREGGQRIVELLTSQI
jgi:RNA-directed DNA polymerase